MTVNITTVALTGDEWNPPYPPIVQIFGWLISCALSLETILGNAMVLLAYRLEKNISKQLNNRFIVSLAISDMIIGVEGIPFFTAFVINGDRWPLGPIACETWLFLDYTLCLVSILTVLLITADRYLSVCHTAYYLKWQTPFKVQMLIFGSWLLPAIIFGLMIYGWPWIGEREEEIRATSNGECYAPFLSNPFVNMSMYLAYYWTTLVAMLILYKGIHKAAKKLEKRSRAREHRHIALLLTQRLGTQVGVGLMLHARKYHEEVMKEKQPPAEVKDSGYTTNNTLSTSEPSDRRRSSFAILAKAVQSTQKLAQFRGRGTTFAFRTNSADENDAPKNRQLAVSIAHVQTKQQQQLERLTEQNSSSQVGAENAGEVREAEKAPVMPRANSVEEPAGNEGEELPSLSLAAPPNSSVKDVDEGNSSWADDEEGGEVDDIDEDEFPTDMVRRRFASGAVPSLSTEFFHDESLSSVLRFNPSALASPLLDQSDTSFDFLANRMGKFGTNNHNQAAVENGVKRHCFSLTSYPRKEFVKLVPMTSGSLKERRMNSSSAQETAALLPQFTESIRNVESTPESAPRKSEEEEEEECVGGDNERDLLCPIIPPPTVKEIASSKEEEIPIVLDVPPHPPQPLIPRFPTTRCLTPAGENAGEVQQRCSSASSSRREERRPSSRKSSHPPPEQVQQQQKSEQQRATTILGQCLRRFSAWIQSSLGVDSRENSSNVAVRDPHVTMPSFMHNSHSFSSMSSISSSTQPPPMASKHGSLLPPGCQKMQQQQIPTLTITRDSLGHNAPQIAGMLSAETKTVEKDAVYLSSRNDECRRSSGFLQTLFAPISSFQRRRKKTKAERRAHKAFRTITFIVGLFAILWSPYYVVATVYGFCRGDCIPAFLYNLSYYMCYLNSSLNPFAYALANRQFRSAFSRILRGNFRQSH